jgi:hypothetical protein
MKRVSPRENGRTADTSCNFRSERKRRETECRREVNDTDDKKESRKEKEDSCILRYNSL